jgi:hypothetical protein
VAQKRVKDDITLENVRLLFRNFSGEKKLYNEGGKRNFAIPLEEDLALELIGLGWNVKGKDRENDQGQMEKLYHLPVTVKMDGKIKPNLFMIVSDADGEPKKTPLDEDTVVMLDWAEFDLVDLTLRPYNWGPIQGNYGVTAYLKHGYFWLHQDDLEKKYAHVQLENQMPAIENIIDVDSEWVDEDDEILDTIEQRDVRNRQALERGRS